MQAKDRVYIQILEKIGFKIKDIIIIHGQSFRLFYIPAPLPAGSRSELVELGPPEPGNPMLWMGADRGLSMGGNFLLRRLSTGPIPVDEDIDVGTPLVFWRAPAAGWEVILPLQLLEEPATLPEQPELPLLEELPADPKIIKKKTLSSGNCR